MSELLGDDFVIIAMLPDYDDIVWQDLKSPAPWIDLDDTRCDIAFAKGKLRDELARLREIERTTDAVTSEWSRRCQALEIERDRLLVLATKHCDKTHHDWQEILRIAGDA